MFNEIQTWARGISGTAGQLNEDLHAAFNVLGVAAGQIGERAIAYTGAPTASVAWQLLRAMGGGGGAPLRFASTTNFIDLSTTTHASAGTQLTYFSRQPVLIGSGNFASLRVSFSGNKGAGDNAFTITKVALERKTPNVTVPMTFSGARSKVINPLDVDIQTDQILPSAFGLSEFTRGSEYWIRFQITVTTAGHFLPLSQIIFNTSQRTTDQWGLRYDPATFTQSDVDSTGTAFSGTGFAFADGVLAHACLLGTPSGALLPVVAGIGDSIVTGTGDSFAATALLNTGFFNRALVDLTDFRSNPFAACNFSRSGTQASLFNGQPIGAYMLRYCSHIVEEYGANGDTGQTTLWSTLAGVGKPIIRTKLMARTTSTDAWATTANQTYFDANWTPPSGQRVIFNQTLDSKFANGDFSALIDFQPDVLDAVDRWKWKGGGAMTSDGLHPNAAAHALMAARLRAYLLTL